MAKNPHFRVLALTATPGGKPEAVQAIVDALHISHIEIRDERSLDLAPYLHKKHVKQHIIEMSDDVKKIRDMLGEVMKVGTSILSVILSRLMHQLLWAANDPKVDQCTTSTWQPESYLSAPIQLSEGVGGPT